METKHDFYLESPSPRRVFCFFAFRESYDRSKKGLIELGRGDGHDLEFGIETWSYEKSKTADRKKKTMFLYKSGLGISKFVNLAEKTPVIISTPRWPHG